MYEQVTSIFMLGAQFSFQWHSRTMLVLYALSFCGDYIINVGEEGGLKTFWYAPGCAFGG